jgi:FAD/FMN-containing dehydrogenase/Fe-S oxidoreductase
MSSAKVHHSPTRHRDKVDSPRPAHLRARRARTIVTTMNLSPGRLHELSVRLSGETSADVHFDDYQRALYSTDASLYQIQPLCVVVPRTVADAVAAAGLAAEFGIPLIARGSGTSLSGQPIGPGMVIDFSKHLNRILEIDPERRTARVQPGVVLDQLNEAAARHGLQFGPDVATSSRANLGGMIGNNSSGARSIRQGKTVDHVIELSVVLSDGTGARLGPKTADELAERQKGDSLEATIYRAVPQVVAANRGEILARYPRVLRRVSGYNLDEFVPETRSWYEPPHWVKEVRAAEAQRFKGAAFNLARLIVGSEGTLATVTEALVHLIPLPKHRGLAVIEVESLEAACDAVLEALPLGPSAIEFFDKMIIALARASLEYRDYLDFVAGDPECVMIVEFSSDQESEVRSKIGDLTERLQGSPGIARLMPALEKRLADHIWACRKASLPLLMGVPGRRKPIAFVEDTAVDPAKLSDFVRRFRSILQDNGTDGAFYGHASVGCLHIRPLIDAADPADLERLKRISLAVCDLVLEFGGSMSGEHGDGLARSYLNGKLFGEKLYRAFKEIKAAFDPENLLNPGKIVDGPSPVENLRLGAGYKTLEVPTVLDFSGQGGFARAVELCNGSGVCRKTQTGTMCPSYMVTRDEEHSTRGRANALRLVLSGVLPPEELTGPRLFQTFDLCLQCKGCKAECPSNVDVAKMKAELLHKHYRKHGVPRGVRMMADIARWNRLGSAFAPLSNWLQRLPGAGWLRERLMNIDRRRPLPAFCRNHFAKWFRHHKREAAVGGRSRLLQDVSPGARGPIVLLDDCLTSFCEPSVNRAAVEVLEAAGYDVILAGLRCCGRAAISKGLLGEAQKLARQNIERLLPYARRGLFIVGAEPSCLLTLCDEYPDLVPGDDARLIARQSRLVETHLVREGILNDLTFSSIPHSKFSIPHSPAVLLHAHCHQKALVGTRETVALLETIRGTGVRVLDSGCCGMAGSFGYEHYELSMKIGERVLFPAIRENTALPIVAPGFSCRHQIEHGTGRQAEHPLEYVVRHLSPHNNATAS